MFASVMEEKTKNIITTLAIASAVGGGFYLINKGKKILPAMSLNFALMGFRIHKISLREVNFVVNLRIYNPTKQPVKIALNQVVAKYNGKQIALSTPDVEGQTISPGQTINKEIMFDAPMLTLLSSGVTTALLSNLSTVKQNMSFDLSVTVNGESISTTQSLNQNNMGEIGQLGIVSGPRNTQDGRQFNHLIKRAEGKDVLIKNGDVVDTVESCINVVAEHYTEVKDLAKQLEGKNIKDTCKNIFDFSYKYLQYKLDDAGTEQLRTPARSWIDGQVKFKQEGDSSMGIDCDDYSIFVGSLLRNLNIPFKFRITKYGGKNYFQHIYVFEIRFQPKPYSTNNRS